ncbi:MAG: hypothetical protein H0U54_05795 [Acidobacteria bacterium]|jgi:hypothetical protein|nr:hypothetical protein [Acidobacteriota bacterium]
MRPLPAEKREQTDKTLSGEQVVFELNDYYERLLMLRSHEPETFRKGSGGYDNGSQNLIFHH